MIKTLFTVTLLLASAMACAQQPTEAQCKRNIEAALSAMESVVQMGMANNVTAAVNANDIKQIEATRGSCEAWREINRRLVNQQNQSAK